MKKIIVLLLTILIAITCCSSSTNAYSLLYNNKPLIHKSQAVQFLKDRHASKKMLDCVDYIYDYGKKVGIDPSIVIAMSSIETGYGKSRLFVYRNNPGGIKSRNGWARYDTAKDGYRAMMNLLATYAGLRNSHSWLYNKSKTTQGLAGIYWTNYGNDRGYHKQLSRQINTMLKYPIKETKQNKKVTKKKVTNKKKSTKKSTNKIIDILNKKSNNSSSNALMKYLK